MQRPTVHELKVLSGPTPGGRIPGVTTVIAAPVVETGGGGGVAPAKALELTNRAIAHDAEITASDPRIHLLDT
jgi:hypothetical protein